MVSTTSTDSTGDVCCFIDSRLLFHAPSPSTLLPAQVESTFWHLFFSAADPMYKLLQHFLRSVPTASAVLTQFMFKLVGFRLTRSLLPLPFLKSMRRAEKNHWHLCLLSLTLAVRGSTNPVTGRWVSPWYPRRFMTQIGETRVSP